MTNVEPVPDQPGPTCGVTQVGGTGIEWVCIRPVHAKVYTRRRGRKGEPIFNANPSADQHYMVPRYPGRGAHPGGTQ